MNIIKKVFAWIVAIVILVVAGISFIGSDLEHIKDTNGAQDYSLNTITDEDIIKREMGSIGGPDKSTNLFMGDTITFSGEKFTGVYEILYDNYIGKSDFWIELGTFDVNSGNFRMVVVHNDQIVADIEPGMMVDYQLEDVTGYVSLRIAGESADFEFSMNEHWYDQHSHS